MRAAYSVIVIGAGPSGAVAAILLARAGWRVTLVEQHRFPHEKVCGECISPAGIDVLRRLRLDPLVRSYGAIPLYFTNLHAADGSSTQVTLSRPAWGVSRHVLDQLLLIEAGRRGADVRQPARCESLYDEGGAPVIRIRDLLTNAVVEERPDWAIVADGTSALLDPPSPSPARTFALKAHFKDVASPDDAIELFGSMDTYGGLSPIENNRWNAVFRVPSSLLHVHADDLEMVWERLVGESKPLRKRLSEAVRVSPFHAAPLRRPTVRRRWPSRVIPVGNAAAGLDPIGGEGMGFSLRTAELAAEYLLRASESDVETSNPTNLQAQYHALWRTRRVVSRAAAKVVSSGVFAGAAMDALQHHERMRQRRLVWTGK